MEWRWVELVVACDTMIDPEIELSGDQVNKVEVGERKVWVTSRLRSRRPNRSLISASWSLAALPGSVTLYIHIASGYYMYHSPLHLTAPLGLACIALLGHRSYNQL
jgi:hypothetical protein